MVFEQVGCVDWLQIVTDGVRHGNFTWRLMCLRMRLWGSNLGIWAETKRGLAADSKSVHQADNGMHCLPHNNGGSSTT